MPRIIAGRWRGHPLKTPSGHRTRPTADRTKEALFSSLADRLDGARFLDVCSGSGSIGLEALSRGALSVDLVESDIKALRILRENMSAIDAEAYGAKLHAKTLSRVIPGLVDRIRSGDIEPGFDIIFIDPPYREGKRLGKSLASAIQAHELLSPGGILVQEADRSDVVPDYTGYGLELIKTRFYGQTAIYTYRQTEAEHGCV